MARGDVVSRRQFLVTGSVGALALAANQAAAQAPAQTLHVKPVPGDVFIDHGINQETRLETLRGYLTPASHFFVRQHSNVPAIDLRTWRLRRRGRRRRARGGSRLRRPAAPAVPLRDRLRRVCRQWPGVLQRLHGQGGLGHAVALRRHRRGRMDRRAAGRGPGTREDPVGHATGYPERARGRARFGEGQSAHVARQGLGGRHAPGLRLQRGARARRPRISGAAIVPGWVGINGIKWVGRIEVRKSAIDVPTTTKTYVLEGPDYPNRVVLREQTLKSAVALPWGGTLPAGRQRVRGFAWSPGGQIRRVEYSLVAERRGSSPPCASRTFRARGHGGTSSGMPGRVTTRS